MLEFYFRIDFDHIFVIGMLFCISLPNFIDVGPHPRQSNDVVSYRFFAKIQWTQVRRLEHELKWSMTAHYAAQESLIAHDVFLTYLVHFGRVSVSCSGGRLAAQHQAERRHSKLGKDFVG